MAQSLTQCKRLLSRSGESVKAYRIYECAPEEANKEVEHYRNMQSKYYIYKTETGKLIKIASNASAVAARIGFSPEYVRGKFSKTPERSGVKRITIKEYTIVKIDKKDEK